MPVNRVLGLNEPYNPQSESYIAKCSRDMKLQAKVLTTKVPFSATVKPNYPRSKIYCN
jgi:hypothetical protein